MSIPFLYNFSNVMLYICFISQIQFQPKMESSSNYVFELPTTEDSLAQFRIKTHQQNEIQNDCQDINPQYLPPQSSMPRRKRKQKRQPIKTTIIKVKALQQTDQTQKKQQSYPPFIYQHLQQSTVSQKIQESFEIVEKNFKSKNNLSTVETKMIDNAQILSYNSSSQQQNEQSGKIMKIQQSINKDYKKSMFKANSLTNLVNMKIPQKYAINCLIKISKSLFSATVFDLYLQEDKKLVLRAIKSPIPFSRNFSIVDPVTNKQLARIKKNFSGTQFILICQDEDKNQRQMMWISYRLNIFGLAGQNTINMLRSKKSILKTDKFSDIKTYWQNGNRKKLQLFANKLAIKKNGKYQMDFHGMVTIPSSKNFIIDDENGLECLLFGKRTDDIYAMNVSHPLSILQAFTMAISSIDGKLLVH